MNLLTPILLALTLQLGDDQFVARESASAALAAAGPLAYPALLSALDSDDAEVRSRARWLLRDQLMKVAGPLVLPTGGGSLPYIDALPFDYPDRNVIVSNYVDLARLTVPYNGSGYPWPDYIEATRLYARDLILAGERPADVRAMLDLANAAQAEALRRLKLND
jgi:hypothetical protein